MKYNLYRKDYWSFATKQKTTTYEIEDYNQKENLKEYSSFKRYPNKDTLYIEFIEVVEFSTNAELKLYVDKVLKTKLLYKGKELFPKEPESKRGLELSSHNIDINSNRVNSYRPLTNINKKRPNLIKEEEKEKEDYKNTLIRNLVISKDFKNKVEKEEEKIKRYLKYYCLKYYCLHIYYYYIENNLINYSAFISILNSYYPSLKKIYRYKINKEGIIDTEEIVGTTKTNLIFSLNCYTLVNSILYKELLEELYQEYLNN